MIPSPTLQPLQPLMSQTLFAAGDFTVTVGAAALGFGAVIVLLLLAILIFALRGAVKRDALAEVQAIRADDLERQIGGLLQVHAEASGRAQALGEALAGRQAELARVMNERLDAVTHRVGQSMEQSTRSTMEQLRHLHERLAVIDSAHKNLTDLTTQVTTLRDVLANKQARGAFGQARMEAIVQDGMPKGSFAFQHTLSNNRRPDCAVFLPDGRALCIDAKFPLESVTALRDGTTDEERKSAAQRLRQDLLKHVSDIAGKYLIPGETHDMALMFVPSESVYAEIHDGFDDVIQKAYRARVVLVSPALLMLAIQVMQQILKDARMREAADQIRDEVMHLADDLTRLRERVVKLQNHFNQANEDVRLILVSADKIDQRAAKIDKLDFGGDEVIEPPRGKAELFAIPSRKLQAGE